MSRKALLALILMASGLVYAQVPISGLPQATLPLTGNESVVMNQNGSTRQGKVSSITSLVTLSAATGIVLTPNPIVGGPGTIGLSIPVAVSSGGTGAVTLSGLILGNGVGPFTPYAGATCTNQFLRSLSASGVGTCNSISLVSDVTGNLPVTNLNSGTGAGASTYWTGNATWSQVNLASGVTGNLSVNNLNSGTGASATTVWTGNGTWTAPAGGVTGLANPTGTIGLTAVNGAATTVLRSDSAPPLSQAIVPTWTGSHGFNGAYVTSAATTLTSPGQQGITFINSTSGANAKIWDILDSTANHLTFRAVNDAFGSAGNWLDVTRSGLSISSLSFGNSTDNPSYSFLGTGRTSFGGTYGGGTTPIVGASAATSNFYGEFDGTHEALFGTFASGGFVGTFSNHEFDFRTNNLARGVIDANGHWTLSPPAAGGQTSFTFNARTGNNAMLVTQQAGAGAAFGLVVQAGTNSSDYNMLLQSQSGSTLFELFGDGGAVVGSPTGGDQGLGTINATGLFVNGVSSACSSGSWSATPSGFSSVASQTFKWSKCGNLVTVIVPAFTGTSNAITFFVGSVPAAIQPASTVTGHCGGFEDNGVLFLEGTVNPSGSTMGFSLWVTTGTHIQENSNGWTNTGTKGLNQGCSFTYSVQ